MNRLFLVRPARWFAAASLFLLTIHNSTAVLLDGGVDPANLGKGQWIYVVANAENHLSDSGYGPYVPSVVDGPSMMSYFKNTLNLQYVVVKAGDGATVYPSAASPQFTASLVNAAHAQGLKIFGYTFTYGVNIPGELAIATNVFNAGGDGFILDDEDAFVSQGLSAATSAAWALCGQFKTNWPTKFLGHSPYADIYTKWGSPSGFPYKEFGYWCDAVMPQTYWQSWSQSTSATARQYGTPILGIQWTDSNFNQFHTWLASQGRTSPTYKDPSGAPWTAAIKPVVQIGQADVPGATNQTYADMTNFIWYLKNDPTCATAGGYKGCCFFRPGLEDNNMLNGIAAISIGEPTITSQPASGSSVLNTTALFSVGATGSGALTYQWSKNGAALSDGGRIAGSSAATLTISSVQSGDAASYTVAVGNFCGSVTSSVVTLTVTTGSGPPTITAQPQNQTVIAGNTASFNVIATGAPPLSYQWYGQGSPLASGTAATLTLNNAQPTQAGTYWAVISNSLGGVTSGSASLAVNYSLSLGASGNGAVASSPSQTSYASNAVVTLSAAANAGSTFLGWSGDLTGASNPATVVMTANKNITAVFSGAVADIIIDDNTSGYATSGTWTTGTSSTDKYGSDYQFANTTTGSATATATYTPTISGAGYYDVYIWYPQGSNRASNAPWTVSCLSGSTTYYVNQQANGGGWRLLASQKNFAAGTGGYVQLANNASGSVVMADAVKFSYSATQAPVITVPPKDQAVKAGSNVTFTVVASGGASPVTYQWRFNGASISGASLSAYAFSNAQTANAGTYSVVVANTLTNVISAPAQLSVTPPVFQLGSVSLLPDGSVSLVLSGDPGSYVVEKSTNLVSWATLTNVTLGTIPAACADPAVPSAPTRFYRARLGP